MFKLSKLSKQPTTQTNKLFTRKETKLGLTNSLPSDPRFTTLARLFRVSHHIPLLHCHSPSKVREKAFLAVTAGLLAAETQPPGLTYFLAQYIQGKCDSSKPPSQVPNLPGREIFSPDWSCPITFRARHSTVCLHCSYEEVPMTQRRCPSQGFLGNRISTCLRSHKTDHRLIQLHLLLPKGADQSAHTPLSVSADTALPS